ncbi:pseudouridine synthase [Corynebacterium lizhenjunii]|uniref:RNA pseudouridylate synthase n=2 Tax=Corynebacterium lizhenjunii TaxID=2709394 RepID=A0A7T0PC87_9CORY|nr:pseudouridine synthase [Corynebacterium lizhenjunii]QPK80295.1 pseudouridine synthase [Corynebacterium lizhenjunii]
MPPSPASGRPPAREGISATKTVLRGVVPPGQFWAARAGDSPFAPGTLLEPGTQLLGPVPAWHFPDLPEEAPIPFDYQVLHVDADLIIVHKPHFLPTTSNGRLVRQTLQTRLRVDFAEPDIVPLHRLDRLTAGVVVCSRNPQTRAAYQQLFSQRQVRKTYQARTVRPLSPVSPPPQEIVLGMRKVKGCRQVLADAAGTPTRTWVQPHPEYVELRPLTGHTHQLRVLLNHLGAPIVGDDTYPVDKGLDLYDFSSPLQLLAYSLEFTDPLTSRARKYVAPYSFGGSLD